MKFTLLAAFVFVLAACAEDPGDPSTVRLGTESLNFSEGEVGTAQITIDPPASADFDLYFEVIANLSTVEGKDFNTHLQPD